jgi:hypothetical protein
MVTVLLVGFTAVIIEPLTVPVVFTILPILAPTTLVSVRVNDPVVAFEAIVEVLYSRMLVTGLDKRVAP